MRWFKRFFCKHYYVLIPFARSKSGVVCFHCQKALSVVINDPVSDTDRPK